VVARSRGGFFHSLHPPNQADECLSRSPDLAVDDCQEIKRKKSEAIRCERFSFDFEQRSSRLAQKLSPLAVCDPAMTLCDLCNDTDCRTSDLSSETKSFICRKRRRDFVNSLSEIQGALKRNKIME
jgi:hypothetical protein